MAQIGDADVNTCWDWSTVRGGIVKTRCYHVVGVTETLVLHRKTLLVMALIRHRVKICNSALNKRILTSSKCGGHRPVFCLAIKSDQTGHFNPIVASRWRIHAYFRFDFAFRRNTCMAGRTAAKRHCRRCAFRASKRVSMRVLDQALWTK
jgi:hypothetical protein